MENLARTFRRLHPKSSHAARTSYGMLAFPLRLPLFGPPPCLARDRQMPKLVAITVILSGLGAILIAGVAVKCGSMPQSAARDQFDMTQPPGSVRRVARDKEPWRFWPRVVLFGAFGITLVGTGIWMWRERPPGHESRLDQGRSADDQ